jgi:hypothetical protein
LTGAVLFCASVASKQRDNSSRKSIDFIPIKESNVFEARIRKYPPNIDWHVALA